MLKNVLCIVVLVNTVNRIVKLVGDKCVSEGKMEFTLMKTGGDSLMLCTCSDAVVCTLSDACMLWCLCCMCRLYFNYSFHV